MSVPEILYGPSARLILRQSGERWTCVVDVRSVGTFVAGMSGLAGPVEGSPTRAEAIGRAVAWMRRFFGHDLHPKQSAWLTALSSPVLDLFGDNR